MVGNRHFFTILTYRGLELTNRGLRLDQ